MYTKPVFGPTIPKDVSDTKEMPELESSFYDGFAEKLREQATKVFVGVVTDMLRYSAL